MWPNWLKVCTATISGTAERAAYRTRVGHDSPKLGCAAAIDTGQTYGVRRRRTSPCGWNRNLHPASTRSGLAGEPGINNVTLDIR